MIRKATAGMLSGLLVVNPAAAQGAGIYTSYLETYTSVQGNLGFDEGRSVGDADPAVSMAAAPQGTASAFADYGRQRVLTTGSAQNPNGTSSVESHAYSVWNDWLQIDLAGASTGFLNSHIYVDAALTASGDGFFTSASNYRLSFGPTGGFTYSINKRPAGTTEIVYATGDVLEGPRNGNLFSIAVPLTFGQPLSLSSLLTCASSAQSGLETVSAKCDSSQSAYWGGIQSVTDADGNVLQNWSATSISGTDYTQSFVPGAVPEPATWAMLIVGFGAVGYALRRRPQRLRQAA